MRLDDLPRSQRVEDRRGQAGGGGFRVPGGRRGSLSLGSIVILLVIGWALGINPLTLIGGAEMLSTERRLAATAVAARWHDKERTGLRPDGRVRRGRARKHRSTWNEIFPAAASCHRRW